MTSVGRGRGFINRDKQLELAKQQKILRRPLSPEVEWQSTLDTLAAKISALDINNVDQLEVIKQEMITYCNSSERLKIMMDHLHERSLNDCKFGVRAAKTIASIALLQVDGVKLRSLLIQNLQYDFKNAETLRTSNKVRYLNAIAFFSEVFNRVKIANSEPIVILADAHIDYQLRLVTGDLSELELCVCLLALNGHQLLFFKAEKLATLILATYSALIQQSDPCCRAWLLLAIHLDSIKYNPDLFSSDYYTLFQNELGVENMKSIFQLLPVSVNKCDETLPVAALSINEGSKDVPRSSGQDRSSNPQPRSVTNTGVAHSEDESPSYKTDSRRVNPQPSPVEENWRDKSRNVEGDNKNVQTRNPGYRTDADAGSGDRTHRPRQWSDPRSNPDTWLPIPKRTEADIKAWGLDPSHGPHWGHDDRHDNDAYSRGEVTRVKDWHGKGDGGRYGSGRIQKESIDKPLPDEPSWD